MFELSTDLTCIYPLHGGSLVVLDSNSDMPTTIRYLDHSAIVAMKRVASCSAGEGIMIYSRGRQPMVLGTTQQICQFLNG
ncbi:hypothetical protein TNCV_1841891 [Trichonephila clavipes]|nr:hypothetical protein TNCV_1841891 [Trichonephila clavipes]